LASLGGQSINSIANVIDLPHHALPPPHAQVALTKLVCDERSYKVLSNYPTIVTNSILTGKTFIYRKNIML